MTGQDENNQIEKATALIKAAWSKIKKKTKKMTEKLYRTSTSLGPIFEAGSIKAIRNSLRERAAACIFSAKQNGKKLAIGVSVLTLFVTGTGYYNAVQGYTVIFNGEEIGMVKNMEDFTEGVEIVKQELSSLYQTDIVFKSDVSFERATIDKEALLSTPQESAAAVYATDISLSSEGAVIVIEGEEVVTLSSMEEAKETIEKVVSSYVNLGEGEELIDEPEIQQDYEIIEKLVAYNEITSIEDAVKYITQGTDEIYEYKVKSGDTSWDIAVNRGINIAELENANPDKDITSLREGDVLKLTEEKPYMDISFSKQEVYTQRIAFDTTYKNDSSIYVGKTKEMTAGVNGVKEITATVLYQNGVEVSREIVNESVIKEPIERVVAKGTKPLPPSQGTGRFRMPTSGRVSVINKAGSHAGGRAVDIANSRGTSIYASDSGRVTRASWYSAYGNTIIIDHGNGFTTLYAHLSSYGVRVGQSVSRGQYIGAMGSTGRSTGNHLHFEIRYNGQRQVITRYFPNLRVGSRVSP
ncbi:M23 family metallopeptidase [Alkalibacter saccharofermentans]|uniref:Murein DD-endopeptidase MepM and murein hydrolase activator NlpD, contain LysM domain n=1 Tax=Alkalibacter saccharofermentans DSM 14828 TaxID=1120975 RepID=A0A1M4Z3T7_9FIRM|nr:M23 family metallopeptidase [Alkalibacter saccharofermentans]SHF12724.1 Murein DD-endopeptidase MepM and murein hydrolase activator NlpD, contain LysM domain [Alkalibacter saccharofermentans DSM 14828]